MFATLYRSNGEMVLSRTYPGTAQQAAESVIRDYRGDPKGILKINLVNWGCGIFRETTNNLRVEVR